MTQINVTVKSAGVLEGAIYIKPDDKKPNSADNDAYAIVAVLSGTLPSDTFLQVAKLIEGKLRPDHV